MARATGIASYLEPGRLADVLALIQVLAFDHDTSRSEEGLRDELQRGPKSTESWLELARHHSEFFRVRSDPDRKPRAALIARYVQDYQPTPKGDEKRPPLLPELTNKLMEFALELHDRELERRHAWKTWIPLGIAIVAAAASVTAAVVSSQKASERPHGPTSAEPLRLSAPARGQA